MEDIVQHKIRQNSCQPKVKIISIIWDWHRKVRNAKGIIWKLNLKVQAFLIVYYFALWTLSVYVDQHLKKIWINYDNYFYICPNPNAFRSKKGGLKSYQL